jgi:hypothetical protein
MMRCPRIARAAPIFAYSSASRVRTGIEAGHSAMKQSSP